VSTTAKVTGPLTSTDDIKGSLLVVMASMPLPDMDVVIKWVRSDRGRCLVWSSFDTKSLNRELYTTFGVAAADIRTPVNSTVSVFGQTFVLDGFAAWESHLTFDGRVPQRPEWGQAVVVATDQRGIEVLHKHALGGSGGVAVIASPFAEKSKLSDEALGAWYKGLFSLCSQ
jgi:hypothetical protein